MNTEIKTQWLADLRSGEYEQGEGALNRDGKLCCLGVLCEQAVKAGIVTKKVREGTTYYYGSEGAFGDASILPKRCGNGQGYLSTSATRP